jgi:heat shock transcription factor, other eukaryote
MSNWRNDDGSKKRKHIALEQGPAAEHETSGKGPSIILYRPPVPKISNQAISVDVAFCATPV